jgi:hypothetical protein
MSPVEAQLRIARVQRLSHASNTPKLEPISAAQRDILVSLQLLANATRLTYLHNYLETNRIVPS